jgi:myo-inositol 2-dehydrogenase/D-chiro-inositol 1-dehydrogenase
MRIGLIGYGNWGKAHARKIKTLDNAELVAISAPSDESRKLAQQEHGVPVYADYHEMLKRSDLDVIDIVAPNYLHQEMATAALQSGRNIILEKPMAAGSDACNAILKIAHDQKKHITICHESRYSPLWGGVKKLIDDGKIGEPRYLLVELWRRPFRPGSSGWKQEGNRPDHARRRRFS